MMVLQEAGVSCEYVEEPLCAADVRELPALFLRRALILSAHAHSARGLGQQPADLQEEMVSCRALAHAAGVACHTHSTRASWRWMASCSAHCWQTKGVLASS